MPIWRTIELYGGGREQNPIVSDESNRAIKLSYRARDKTLEGLICMCVSEWGGNIKFPNKNKQPMIEQQ